MDDDCHMTSESGVIRRLEQEGFTEHFVVKGPSLESIDTRVRFGPRDVAIREFARYEGVSNPSDMSIVYAVESRDGVRGTLVDAFGAYADPDVAAFVDAVEQGPGTIVLADVGTPPGPPAPGTDDCR